MTLRDKDQRMFLPPDRDRVISGSLESGHCVTLTIGTEKMWLTSWCQDSMGDWYANTDHDGIPITWEMFHEIRKRVEAHVRAHGS